jgi:hypothetical protein
MIRHILIFAAAFLSLGPGAALAQTPRINAPAARLAVQTPQLATPNERAALASRVTGETISATAITGTASVSVLAPVVGDPRAPSLSLEIRRGTWITTGDDPRAVITSSDTTLDLKFATAANTRYLVLCNVTRDVRLASIFGQPAPALTWEGPERAAILVPRLPEGGVYWISFTGGGTLRSCEVSRIG